MADMGISDTIAYKIVDQIVSHVHPNQEFSENDFLKVFNAFMALGGKWEDVVNGDPKSFEKISKLLSAFFKIRKHPKKYGIK